MEILVEDLREALEMVGPVAPKKPTLPVTESVLVADGHIYATNLEVAVAVQLGLDAGEPFLLPFRTASYILKHMPGSAILTLNGTPGTVSLRAGHSSATLRTGEVDEFPPFPGVLILRLRQYWTARFW